MRLYITQEFNHLRYTLQLHLPCTEVLTLLAMSQVRRDLKETGVPRFYELPFIFSNNLKCDTHAEVFYPYASQSFHEFKTGPKML